MIRPILLYLTYQAVNGKDSVGNAPVAIELMHLSSLIHDDLIDKAEMRRSRPSFHRRYGYVPAILIVDYVFSLCLRICAEYPDKRVSIELSKAASMMSIGEYLESELLEKRDKISMEEYLNVLRKKTASLFEAACKIGAIIGGGNDTQIKMLGEYGLKLGLTYQLRDDLLDWNNRKELSALLSNSDKKEVSNLSIKYSKEALETLKNVRNEKVKKLLRDIAYFTVKRTK